MAIAFRPRTAVGMCDLRYESATLDRYPAQDSKNMPLPEKEMPLFAFPYGLRLEFANENKYVNYVYVYVFGGLSLYVIVAIFHI